MLLRNVFIVGGKDNELKDLLIENGSIRSVLTCGMPVYEKSNTIHFENVIAFPGLINSHDHLDFNLFPPLGNQIYSNYRQWGNDIHQQNKTAIEQVLKVPQNLRMQWGMYKNLLSGVTTVVNHGNHLSVKDPLLTVFQDCHSLHSVGFEKKWRWRLNKPRFTDFPFAIHTGEGTDQTAHDEVHSLIRWNLFRKPLIGIHGVAMDAQQAASFKALVWCPASNFFLLGKTTDIKQLKKHTQILFGTDSTLTAEWNIWNHLRMARETALLTDKELLGAVTCNAAEIWKMTQKAMIREGCSADLVIARKNDISGAIESFYQVNPEDILLVMIDGKIKMLDASLFAPLAGKSLGVEQFSKFSINGNDKYVIGDLPKLIAGILQYYPSMEFPVTVS